MEENNLLMYLRLKRILKTIYKLTGLAGKTLWDFLQLLAMLAIPIVVLIVSISFTMQQDANNQRQHQTELNIAQDNRKNDMQIATNQQQDTILAAYLDNMTSLLLNNKLRESKPGDEVRNVARSQTISALRRLEPVRKVIVLRFLFEANLISIFSLDDAELEKINLKNLRPIGNVVIRDFSMQFANLTGASIENYQVEHSTFGYTNLSHSTLVSMKITFSDFSYVNLSYANISDTEFSYCLLVGADLSSANLSKVNLTKTDLSGANLSKVNLTNTDLSGANFSGADLSYADLRGAKVTPEQLALAKSLKGTIMPDGSIHP
jgi:uncharacterized protein YjbI with pentapeptide repeats